ncbi:hypothetical protein P389DRAFT_47874 [Cystobasidium minutum MCA 4210]|uniref:uncharacterized protein n=1 Tax=Cystobasidium minutum MCA 4210 TaxID=1397322 RepID=UPI0034CEC15F|eukprot:jgi/Rhomi1/47874/CE47873_953
MQEPPLHDHRHPAGSSSSSRSCSRAREARRSRSGSRTPVAGGVLASGGNNPPARLPSSSRPSSPSRLRSLPSVGVSNVEALSDGTALLNNGFFSIGNSNVNGDSNGPLNHFNVDPQLLADAALPLLEDSGKDKEASLPPPRPITPYKYAEEPISEAGISDYTFIPKEKGGLLGSGKFSSVQLAWKHGVKYAIKITPLYPHHNLIATRLLREPTILAQLPLHPNLVKVYESIRTPGHFYLVEEYLESYINLESFVSSQPESKLTISQTLHIFHQLVSVVRSALHEPIQIAHRDIKPENILINPITLRIILLDFGLSTHFSNKEAKLTTCCGSPAFHSPELVKSLRSQPGSVKYWGPEIDIWTIGITILRCAIGVKYPLGVKHTSLQHLNDKCIDAVLSVQNKELRHILAGLLDMDGEKRMTFFRELPEEIDQIPYKTLDPEDKHDYLITTSSSAGGTSHQLNGYNRQFKNTTFIGTEPKHSLSLIVASPPSSANPSGILTQETSLPYQPNGRLSSFLRSRSQSRDRLSFATASNGLPGLELSAVDERLSALNPSYKAPSTQQSSSASASAGPASPTLPLPTAPSSSSTCPELILLNPEAEPAMRAISYVKYALRCAGIIYHIQSDSEDLSSDTPSLEAPKEDLCYPILHCVRIVPPKEIEASKSPAASLLNQLRPPLTRAATMGAAVAGNTRSSSTPPNRHNSNPKNGSSNSRSKSADETVRCAEFWVQIVPVFAIDKEEPQSAQQTDAANMVKSRERSASQKRRPKSKSRGLSAMNIHQVQHHHEADLKKCTKLRLRISDETLVEVLRKALSTNTSGVSGTVMDNYAMYATPPPAKHAALRKDRRGERKMTTSGEEEGETSLEEEDKDRGRPLVSRSRSDEKSRSRSKTRRPLSQAGAKSGSPAQGRQHDHMRAPSSAATSRDATSRTRNTTSSREGSKTRGNRDDENLPMRNGLLEAKLDSEEEARQAALTSHQNNAKRGFFDFVSAFNIRSKPPTMTATAPTTPAAIPEDLEPETDQAEEDPKNMVKTTTKPVPAVAFAAM